MMADVDRAIVGSRATAVGSNSDLRSEEIHVEGLKSTRILHVGLQ